jgi:hypothetical protein
MTPPRSRSLRKNQDFPRSPQPLSRKTTAKGNAEPGIFLKYLESRVGIEPTT